MFAVLTVNDLIDRRAAIDALKEEEYPCESDYDEGYMAALKKSVWIMEKWLPSAQPEIIRCRQCKQFRRWIDTDFHFCDRTEVEVSLDDFCSRAERREDG